MCIRDRFNWHMENSNFLYEAAYRASERGTRTDVKILIMETPFDSFDEKTMDFLYPDGFPGWGVEHAAMFETAMLLYIAPELVQMDKAVDDGPVSYTHLDVYKRQGFKSSISSAFSSGEVLLLTMALSLSSMVFFRSAARRYSIMLEMIRE